MPGDIAALQAVRASLGAGPFLLLVVVGVTIIMVIIAVLRRSDGRIRAAAATVMAVALTWVSLAGIAELTLFGPLGLGADPRVELDPIIGARGWAGIAWRPVLDNVTLFVPLGAALAALWWRRRALTVLAVAILISVAVETFQWAYPSGRIANTADVIANTVGAAVGILIARAVEACLRR
jgi:glycopeptide antibiotics resistance protein